MKKLSDTPRTDNEHVKTLTPAYEYEGAEIDAWDWARKLERECDNLAKQCVKNVEEIGTLRAQLREAKKDAARMDWWMANSVRFQDRDEIDIVIKEAANDV